MVINTETHRLPSKSGAGPFASLGLVDLGLLCTLLQLRHGRVLQGATFPAATLSAPNPLV